MLHEWSYELKKRPSFALDGKGEFIVGEETVENLTTWVYEDSSFVPSAKIVANETFSIISDYIGRPVQAYNQKGEKVWETDYDIYGRLRNLQGEKQFVPFRQLGQYEDEELEGLYYNRFRYYDCNIGGYISQDPIGLEGNNPNFYAYTYDSNGFVDVFGLGECPFYTGKLSKPASEMKPIKRGSKEWNEAVKAQQEAVKNGERFQVRVESSSDAKAFLKESQGNMNRYKAQTQSGRPDGVPKYPKGYEQHMAPEGGLNDLQHIKYYNNGTDGHIFYEIPN